MAPYADIHDEQLLRALDRSPTGVALVGLDGHLLHVNDALCELLGDTRESLTGKLILDIAASQEAGDRWADATFSAGLPESLQLEARLRRGDGAEVVALVGAAQVQDAAGTPVSYLCHFEDVTSRVHARELLELNEGRLADAQQVARLGSWDWDIASGEVTCSDELYRICGRRPERGTRGVQDLLDQVHPDDRGRTQRSVEQALAAATAWQIDYRIVRPDGGVRTLHSRGEVVCDPAGNPIVLHGTCQDVTDARDVEDALRATEQLFRRAFDDSPIGMALLDLDGRWLRLNRALGQLCGYSEAQMRTLSIDELSHPDDNDLDRPLVRELLAGRRRSHALEKRMIHAEGHDLHILGHVSLMHGDGERPLYFLVQVIDLSERRQLELEQQDNERRRAELERRLAQSERLESVGQLAGGVAHDFNNLLTVILSCADFAARELGPDHKVRDDVVEIQRAAERAAALTRQLLMFSRREVVTPEVFDFAALVRDLESLLARSLGELVELRIDIEEGLPAVLADRSRFEQVLVNLAVNARDAMSSGGVLTITVRGLADAVEVCVRDEGSGMAPDVVERAFEPFFTTKAVGEGTGLGLATVHGVITDSGGTIAIESEAGRGTLVRFTVPAAGDLEATRAVEPEAGAATPRATARVLVVEDQDPVRRQAVRILEAEGYEVRGAASADEALAGWEPCDVLLTDFVMPGMNGYQLAQEAAQRLPGLKVVFMSGHTEDVLVLDGARGGELAFVQKPFTRRSLLGTVAAALAEPAAGTEPGDAVA